MSGPSRVGIVVSCHGTVERVEDIAAFVRNIRRGRPPPDEVVMEVTRRFERIGGSPLMRITREQAAALEERLEVPVRAAGRLWHPFPAEAIAELTELGVDTVASLPLAPQSTHVYNAAVEEAATAVRFVGAPGYGLELCDAFVEAIEEARARLEPDAEVALVLTAHSLPQSVVDGGDPYERDFREMALAVGERLERSFRWTRMAFQSQGMGGGAWLAPDLDSTMAELHEAGARQLLIAPVGFLADHVETLYDLDIAAAEHARSLGFIQFERMPAMNTRPAFLDALEGVAKKLLARAEAA
jgi:ferrochelatase